MAPMIDMVFLLLVFFMTVGTMARDARPPVDLAEAAAGRAPGEPAAREVITVQSDPDGAGLLCHHGARPLAADAIGELLTRLLAANPELTIELRLAHGLPFREIEPILAACAAAGAHRLAFTVYPE